LNATPVSELQSKAYQLLWPVVTILGDGVPNIVHLEESILPDSQLSLRTAIDGAPQKSRKMKIKKNSNLYGGPWHAGSPFPIIYDLSLSLQLEKILRFVGASALWSKSQ
jgi:hypothetical protein